MFNDYIQWTSKHVLDFPQQFPNVIFTFDSLWWNFVNSPRKKKKRRLALFWQSVFNDYIHELSLNKKSSVENVYSKKQWHGGILICNLISDLRNQSQFKTIQKFLVLHPWFFFWVCTLKKSRFWKPGFFSGCRLRGWLWNFDDFHFILDISKWKVKIL